MNCLLYARVSTDRQAQTDLSIPAQLDAMREHAKKNGWHVVGHFVDEGESARTADRPELKNLLQRCREEKDVDAVIIHKIDRLARNLVDYATIKAILKQKGVRLVSVCEPFDDNPVGNLLENIIASISEWYSANLGQEIKKANLAKLKKGEWPSKPPIGYKSVKGENNRVKHVIDEATSSYVRQAFSLYATGRYSLKTLSEEMHARGMKTKHGKLVSCEFMKKVLMNRFYIGRLPWKDGEYKGIHETFIKEDLFHRAQDILKKRSADSGEKGKLDFLLRGVAVCKSCGKRLTGEVHPRGSYYRCIPDIQLRAKCTQPYSPVSHLDEQLDELYTRIQPPREFLELLRLEIHEIVAKRKKTATREVSGLKKKIAEIEAKEMKLLDEMLAGKVAKSIYEKMEKSYSEKRKEAESRLSQLDVDYDDPVAFLDKTLTVAGLLPTLHRRFGYEQRKMLLKAVFERIEVEDRTIVGVKLNPPFSIFMGEDGGNLFEKPPTLPTKS